MFLFLRIIGIYFILYIVFIQVYSDLNVPLELTNFQGFIDREEHR